LTLQWMDSSTRLGWAILSLVISVFHWIYCFPYRWIRLCNSC